MAPPPVTRPGALAGAVLTCALVLGTGCASLRPVGREDAVGAALRSTCGAPGAVADSACVVREAKRVSGGYRVVVDRRPPAGRDRVAVVVRRGGVLGGWLIHVTPLEAGTGAARP